MVDFEVVRLRRLRASALKLRAVAWSLAGKSHGDELALVTAGAHAAWRVARTVSGRLRVHPYAEYQKDPGVGLLLKNGFVATAASFGSPSRARVVRKLAAQLRETLRELEHVRAFTWASDLSDTLGRSQFELRGLINAAHAILNVTSPIPGMAAQRIGGRVPVVQSSADSPFLTF